MLKHICVFDFETDGKDPNTCNPVELACVMIDPYSLEVIPGSEFDSYMRPEGIDKEDYLTGVEGEKRLETVKWHAKLRKCSNEEILDKWKNAPLPEVVWPLFVAHVEKYNKTKSQFEAPIAAGMNIKNYDLFIVSRLNEKFGIKRLFNHEIIDIRDMALFLLIWDNTLKSRSMDSLRNYFGMAESAAHTAIADVKDSATIITRCLKYFKSGFKKDKFRNSMKVEPVN
jgi:hypothetical protein